MRSTVVIQRAALGSVIAAAILVGGCAPQKTKNAGSSLSVNETGPAYITAYQNSDFSEAYRLAAKAALDGNDGEQAKLIAGQAAHALGNFGDAQRWLRPLLDSSNKQIAGQAGATLGLVAQQNGDHQQAADLLLAAGNKLTLDAAAKSQLYAGDSLSRLGKNQEAQDAWEKAKTNAKYDETLKSNIESRLANGQVPGLVPKQGNYSKVLGSEPQGSSSYTLQSGVFSTLSRAVKAANEITPQARRAGYEAPRVVNTFDTKGKRVYAVRFGHFANKDLADSARAKFGSGVISTRATGE